MTFRIARRLMGLATGLALMASAMPANAADMGGIRDYGGAGGVPVPAPAPIPVSDAEWYIGVAAGGVLSDQSTVDEIGTSMPVRDSSDLAKTLYGGISMGRYVTPNFRTELAVEAYGSVKIAGPQETHYSDAQAIDGSTIVGHYDVTRTDTVRVGRTTGMFNLYYDIPVSERFKPYVGAGIGVTWRSMKRKATERADCQFSTDASDPAFNNDACAGVPKDLQNYTLPETKYEVDRFDLALAAMAGISYAITDDIIWDNGYQLLWENGDVALTTPTHAGTFSTVTYGGGLQHQFRTGLRFVID